MVTDIAAVTKLLQSGEAKTVTEAKRILAGQPPLPPATAPEVQQKLMTGAATTVSEAREILSYEKAGYTVERTPEGELQVKPPEKVEALAEVAKPAEPTAWERVTSPKEAAEVATLFAKEGKIIPYATGAVEKRITAEGTEYRIIPKEIVEFEERKEQLRAIRREEPARYYGLWVSSLWAGGPISAVGEVARTIARPVFEPSLEAAGEKELESVAQRTLRLEEKPLETMIWGMAEVPSVVGVSAALGAAKVIPSVAGEAVRGFATGVGIGLAGIQIGKPLFLDKDYVEVAGRIGQFAAAAPFAYYGFKAGQEFVERPILQAEKGYLYPTEKGGIEISKVRTKIGSEMVDSKVITRFTVEDQRVFSVSRLMTGEKEAVGLGKGVIFGEAGKYQPSASISRVISEKPGRIGAFERWIGGKLDTQWGYDITEVGGKFVSTYPPGKIATIGKAITKKGEGIYEGLVEIMGTPDEFAYAGSKVLMETTTPSAAALAKSVAVTTLKVGKVSPVVGIAAPSVVAAVTPVVKAAPVAPPASIIYEAPVREGKGVSILPKEITAPAVAPSIISAPLGAEFSLVGKLLPLEKEPITKLPELEEIIAPRPSPRVLRLEARERVRYGELPKAQLSELRERQELMEYAGLTGITVTKQAQKQEQEEWQKVIGLQKPSVRVDTRMDQFMEQQLGMRTIYGLRKPVKGRVVPITPAVTAVAKPPPKIPVGIPGWPKFKLEGRGRVRRARPSRKYYEEKVHPGDILRLIGLGEEKGKKGRRGKLLDDFIM